MPKLTARQVQTLKTPGSYADGGGLYLQIAPGGSRSWILRFQREGRRRELGLGGVDSVSLAEARDKAIEARRQLVAGTDPIEARRAERAERAKAEIAAVKTVTFREAAVRFISAHKVAWRNPKHRAQWPSTLETYVFPTLGALPIETIDTGLVLKAIEGIWSTKPETANRVRGRIEAIIDWAKARGYRDGENPARWRGHLENLLPRASKVRRIKHHAALPYQDVGAFVLELRRQEGVAARALEFAILTAARTGEVIGACWEEFDLAGRLWTIPGDRMKGGREHRVPLSTAALAVIEQMAAICCADVVFPSLRSGRPISNMAMLMTLRRMNRGDLTAHGFRSTFRDWAAERTGFPAEVAEMARAHAVGDKVEAAYRRGDLFDKRRQIMDAWSKFCGQPEAAGEVVPLRGGRRASQK